jgi:hypothetical protein
MGSHASSCGRPIVSGYNCVGIWAGKSNHPKEIVVELPVCGMVTKTWQESWSKTTGEEDEEKDASEDESVDDSEGPRWPLRAPASAQRSGRD